MTEESSVRIVVNKYLDGVATDDRDLVRSAFHPEAVMTGHFEGVFSVIPNAGGFIADFMESAPPTAETSPNLTSSIDSVEVVGSMARVSVSENGLAGADFTTYFTLHKVDGEWIIAAKATYAAAP